MSDNECKSKRLYGDQQSAATTFVSPAATFPDQMQYYNSAGVGHWSLFADPIQPNPINELMDPIQSINIWH